MNVNKIQSYPDLTLSIISGSLGQLIAERGRLPEDLSLHYHSQVLAALEYLVKKKVAHLDIKGRSNTFFPPHMITTVKLMFRLKTSNIEMPFIMLAKSFKGQSLKKANILRL